MNLNHRENYLTSFEIENFRQKIDNWGKNPFLTEKEIETEFYTIMERYYFNKYTLAGLGRIDYCSNHRIDGILNVRTIENDYRILVESKKNKNFLDEEECNSVLSQALYYMQKIFSYGEQIPSVILLLDMKNLLVYESSQFEEIFSKEFIEHDKENINHGFDSQIFSELQDADISYSQYNLYNEIEDAFTHIDDICIHSIYGAEKKEKYIKNEIQIDVFCAMFLKENLIAYSNHSKHFLLFNKDIFEWETISKNRLSLMIVTFATQRRLKIFHIPLESIIGYIMQLTAFSTVEYISLLNGVLNLANSEITEKSSNFNRVFVKAPFKRIKANIPVENPYALQTLFQYICGEIRSEQKIIIISEAKNLNKIRDFMASINFKSQLSRNPKSFIEDYLLIDKNSRNGVAENLLGESPIIIKLNFEMTQCELFNIILDYGFLNNLSPLNRLEANILEVPCDNYLLLNEWNENNDLFLAWFNDCLELQENSYILLQDAFDSFNSWLVSRGNSKLSMRYFTSNFVNHRIFTDNKLEYKTNQRIPKSLSYFHSVWNNRPQDLPKREPREKESYILNVAFS